MKFKILKPNELYGWVFNKDEELYKALGFDCWMDSFIRILAQIPGTRKKDIFYRGLEFWRCSLA